MFQYVFCKSIQVRLVEGLPQVLWIWFNLLYWDCYNSAIFHRVAPGLSQGTASTPLRRASGTDLASSHRALHAGLCAGPLARIVRQLERGRGVLPNARQTSSHRGRVGKGGTRARRQSLSLGQPKTRAGTRGVRAASRPPDSVD